MNFIQKLFHMHDWADESDVSYSENNKFIGHFIKQRCIVCKKNRYFQMLRELGDIKPVLISYDSNKELFDKIFQR